MLMLKMTQAHIDSLFKNGYLKRIKSDFEHTKPDLFVPLNENKHVRLYYSKCFKDHVLSFNINKTKSFIITRQMWQKFRPYISEIDYELRKLD